jgi:hypothetical protein
MAKPITIYVLEGASASGKTTWTSQQDLSKHLLFESSYTRANVLDIAFKAGWYGRDIILDLSYHPDLTIKKIKQDFGSFAKVKVVKFPLSEPENRYPF